MACKVPRTHLGSQGLEVSVQGLGCMGMSAIYGPPKPEQDMIALIHHAVESGVTFLDTSDIYGPFTNEILLGKALKGIRNKVQLATKFGICYENGVRTYRGHPSYVRSACEASLRRLDVDCIDLYYQHRVDTRVPIEVTVGEMKKLVEEGKVKYLGLSEASASTIRRAHAVHPITAVQLEWSLWSRDVEEDIIPTCRELGIGIVAYSPLGRGFLSAGAKVLEGLSDADFRVVLLSVQLGLAYINIARYRNLLMLSDHLQRCLTRFLFGLSVQTGQPRLKGDNLENNQNLFKALQELASRKGCRPGQLALAWVQHQGADVVPIPGTTKVINFEENVGALQVKLSKKEIEEIEALFPDDAVAGDRYDGMNAWTFLNSETPPLSSWPVQTASQF